MLDTLPFDVLYRLMKLFLGGGERIQLRMASRAAFAAVHGCYPAQPSIRFSLDMDRVEAATSAQRYARMLLPGRVRLFYVYHPVTMLSDIVDEALVPSAITSLSDPARLKLNVYVRRWVSFVCFKERRILADRLFKHMIKATDYRGLRLAWEFLVIVADSPVYYTNVWSLSYGRMLLQ